MSALERVVASARELIPPDWRTIISWFDFRQVRKVLLIFTAGGVVLSQLGTVPYLINFSWATAAIAITVWTVTQVHVQTLLSHFKSRRPVAPYAVFFGIVFILSVMFIPWKYPFTWERLEVSVGPVYSEAESIGLWALRFANHSDVVIELDVIVILTHDGERFPVPAEEESNTILVGPRDESIISRLGFTVPPGLDGRWMYSQPSWLEVREIRSGKKVEYYIAQLEG